jgi:hypothetical protein
MDHRQWIMIFIAMLIATTGQVFAELNESVLGEQYRLSPYENFNEYDDSREAVASLDGFQAAAVSIALNYFMVNRATSFNLSHYTVEVVETDKAFIVYFFGWTRTTESNIKKTDPVMTENEVWDQYATTYSVVVSKDELKVIDWSSH